jgi:hypothetical protein
MKAHIEGVQMSLWDQHSEFLAEQIADLVFEDARERKALLSLMRKAYENAHADLSARYHEAYGLIEIEGEDSASTGRQGRLEEGLYSIAIQAYEDLLLSPATTASLDEKGTQDTHQLFQGWLDNPDSPHPALSGRFEVQRFSRAEIERWLLVHQIDSKYAFVPEELSNGADAPVEEPLDRSVLATPAELLGAFKPWGLKPEWFNSPGKHDWLLKARKVIGVGGNRPKPPLFCPFEVMVGLTTKTRKRFGAKRMSQETGWRMLKAHFPSTYEKFRHLNPDDDQS